MNGLNRQQSGSYANARMPSVGEVHSLLRRLARSSMPPLRALILSDGRPGHYHLAEGILAAIGRRRPVEVTRLDVRRRRLAPGRLLASLVNSGASPGAVLRLGYGLGAGSLSAADLVVSAGGDTLAANAAAARLLGVPNIFYGSLRRFKPEDFSLVLTSYARNAGRPRHVMTPKPSAFDPDALSPAAARQAGEAPAVAGLLVGGNTTTVRYSADDWSRLIAAMKAVSRAHGTRWIVSNSRRTPPEATARLARLAAEPESPILELIDVGKAGCDTLGNLFARAEAIVATIDSSSMVSEAVWARRPVIAVAPAAFTLTESEGDYRRYLEASGWARSTAIAEFSAQRMLGLLAEIKPLEANPLDLLAETLAEKVPGLFARPDNGLFSTEPLEAVQEDGAAASFAR